MDISYLKTRKEVLDEMNGTMASNTVNLFFRPGEEGRRFDWISSYEKKLVGLCSRPFCGLCDLSERDKLKEFRGGELEVTLIFIQSPSIFEERGYFLAHLVAVPEQEVRIDEGIEVDLPETSNTFIFSTPQGSILIDPGGDPESRHDPEIIRSFRGIVSSREIGATIISHAHQDHWCLMEHVEKGPIFLSSICRHFAARTAAIERSDRFLWALRRAEAYSPGDPIILRNNLPVKIDTISLPHSVPETAGIIIQGPRKRVVYLGDFKLTGMYPLSKAKTVKELREVAEERVDLLVFNAINSHVEGFTPIESLSVDSMTDIIIEAWGRVIYTSFSSNLERIRRVVDIARLLGKRVAFVGAGMKSASKLIGVDEEGQVDDASVIFVTGCQGEKGSVLWRIIEQAESPLKLLSSDTLVFSSRTIPGYEEKMRVYYRSLRPFVGRMILNKREIQSLGLQSLGAEERLVHVSGHGSREDYRLAMEILRPKAILPWPQQDLFIEPIRRIAENLRIEILPDTERIIEI